MKSVEWSQARDLLLALVRILTPLTKRSADEEMQQKAQQLMIQVREEIGKLCRSKYIKKPVRKTVKSRLEKLNQTTRSIVPPS